MLPLWDTQPHKRPPAFTVLIIATCVVIFGYEAWLAMQAPPQIEAFIAEHALVPKRLISGWQTWEQWQTVFTSMFLHGGMAHLLGNCWFLWIFGRSVESRLGPARYLPLYLVCGVAAAATQVAFSWGSEVPMLGASGAISGVLGAYFVLFPTAWVVALVPWVVPIVPIPAVVFLFLWFLLQAWSGIGEWLGATNGAVQGGVAWWAHAGGFAAGAIIGLALRRAGRSAKVRAPS